MANAAISQLAISLSVQPDAADLVPLVDVSNTTQSGNGSTVKNRYDLFIPAFTYMTLNRATGQSVSNTTLTNIAWTSERSDSPGWHAANSADVVLPAGHMYLITCQVGWDVNSAGDRYHHIEMDNGTDTRVIAAFAQGADIGFGECTGSLATAIWCATQSTIRVVVYQDSGGTRTFGPENRPLTSAGISNNAELTIVKLA